MRITIPYCGLLVVMDSEEETVGSEYVVGIEVVDPDETPSQWSSWISEDGQFVNSHKMWEDLNGDEGLQEEYWIQYREKLKQLQSEDEESRGEFLRRGDV